MTSDTIRVTVYRINDTSQIPASELCSKRIGTYHAISCRGRDLKRWVAKKTGVPPRRQVYHSVVRIQESWSSNRPNRPVFYRFGGPMEVVSDCCLPSGSLDVAVLFLPEEPEAADDEDGDDDIRVVREANALEEGIARGRARAVEVPDSDKEGCDGNDDDVYEPTPRSKRRRTAAARTGRASNGKSMPDAETNDRRPSAATGQEAEGAGGDAGEKKAAAAAADATSERGGDASVRGDSKERKNGAGNKDAVADEAEAGSSRERRSRGQAAVAEASADGKGAAPAQDTAPPASALRRWLRDLDRELGEGDDDDGRFEAFAPAFEREFRSLADLAFAAHRLGAAKVMAACGVKRCGDRARLEVAIGELGRPLLGGAEISG